MERTDQAQGMTAAEKRRDLYYRQKQLLDTFLAHGAISRAQYDKSFGDLTAKMWVMTWSTDWKLRALEKGERRSRTLTGAEST